MSVPGFAAGLVTAALVVVDGDTVRDPATGQRLRLERIDAPERGHRAACLAEHALGERVAARLEGLVAGGVVVEYSGRADRWNRPLVTLRLPDGRAAGDVLVASGLAVPWTGRKADFCR